MAEDVSERQPTQLTPKRVSRRRFLRTVVAGGAATAFGTAAGFLRSQASPPIGGERQELRPKTLKEKARKFQSIFTSYIRTDSYPDLQSTLGNLPRLDDTELSKVFYATDHLADPDDDPNAPSTTEQSPETYFSRLTIVPRHSSYSLRSPVDERKQLARVDQEINPDSSQVIGESVHFWMSSDASFAGQQHTRNIPLERLKDIARDTLKQVPNSWENGVGNHSIVGRLEDEQRRVSIQVFALGNLFIGVEYKDQDYLRKN